MTSTHQRHLSRLLAQLVFLSLSWSLAVSEVAADEGITPVSLADRTARPEIYNAAQELLWPWRETHFNCVSSTTLMIVGKDAEIQQKIQAGVTEDYENKLSAIIERAYGRCRPYLDGAVSRIDEWNAAVASHPITGDYRKLLLESYVSGAFLGVKSALVYFSEAPDDYNIRTVEQLHADMVAKLADPERKQSVAEEIGGYVEIVERSHGRFMQIAPPS